MATWQIIATVFGALWLLGFFGTLPHIERSLVGVVMTFFLWPYISWQIARSI